MRFNLLGFKGDLFTAKKKKKGKEEKKEDAIVGVGFRLNSEFEPGTSRFVQNPQMNGERKTYENGSVPTNLGQTNIPKNWCGTTVPTSTVSIPPEGITLDPEASEPIKLMDPPAGKLRRDAENEENEQIQLTKSKNWCGTPVPPPELEKEDEEEEEYFTIPASNTLKFKEVVKEKKTAPKPSALELFTSQSNTTTTSANDDQHKSPLISMTQRSDFSGESSEDEFGERKVTMPSSYEEKERTRSVAPKPQENRDSYQGYSDQAASIFFRSDSPEPEERIRNFSIKNGDDSDDGGSQTSA